MNVSSYSNISGNDDNSNNYNPNNIKYNNTYQPRDIKSTVINTQRLPMASRNPYIRQSKPILNSNYKKTTSLLNNIMNLVSFFNSFSPNNNINIPSLNTLTKLKSVNNFNQSLNNNHNINSIPNYLSNKRYDNIMRKYYENINTNNEMIIKKTAFGEYSQIQPDNKEYRTQIQTIKYKMDNDTNNIYMNNNNNSKLILNNNNNCDVVDYNNFKLNGNNPEVKIVQFNNVMIRKNKSYIDPRRDKTINQQYQ